MASRLRKIVFFMVLVGMACSAYQFMIRPANKNLAEQKAKLQTKAAKLAEFEKATAAAQGLNKQLEQLREAIDFFESKLPPTSEIDKVLHDVTVIMEEKGLRSKRVLRLKEKNNSGYIEQPLKMELVGNFNSFYSFLLELEKLPRIMKIRELEVKRHIKEEGRITSDFIVSIFFQSKVG